MKTRFAWNALLVATVAALIGSRAALAQECGAPAQARVEPAGGVLSGDGTMWSDLGAPHRSVDAAAQANTREQVRAELAQALRDDTIQSGDSTGAIDLANAMRHPALAAAVDAARQRQVRTEMSQAVRTDSIVSGDGTMWKDLGAPQPRGTEPVASANCLPAPPVMAAEAPSIQLPFGE